jgi:spectinomycin phosphotransferase
MFTRPDGFPDGDVAAALATGWGLSVAGVEYAPVGYGSHHWNAVADGQRWFVTVDDLDSCRRSATESRTDAADRLRAALTVARSLREGGLDFVVAPVPTLNGGVLHPIDDRYVVALYPHVEGETHSWGAYPTRDDRLDVLDRVVQVHRASAAAEGARADDFAVPGRDALDLLLDEDVVNWGPGPYAVVARDLLRRHRDSVVRVLREYDRLVVDVGGRPERTVLTHGEPHRGNTINTATGVVLIDWDTALRAPPERDLWSLIDEDPSIAAEYAARTGVAIDDAALRLYRLWWDLCEISLYTALFRAPHVDSDDTRVAWGGLETHLDPSRWTWPNRSG